MVQPTNHLHGAFECVKPPITVVADVHHASTVQTVSVEYIEFPVGKVRVFWPLVRHRADFRVRVYIMEVVKWLKYFTTKIILVLAPYRTVVIRSNPITLLAR